MTALLLVMVIVVGAVVAYGLVVGVAEKGENPVVAPRQADGPRGAGSGYATLDHKPFPEVAPWRGEVGGREGRVAVGMSRAEVVDQFGPPHGLEINHVRTKAGVEILTWYARAEGNRIFRSSGPRLIVKVDRGSDRVVWFQPPDPTREPTPRSVEQLPGR